MAGMRTRRVYLEDLGVGHGAEEQARAEGEPLAKDHGVVVTPAKGVVKSAAWLFFFLDVDALFPRDKISPSRYQGQARSQTEAPEENRRPGEARVVKWWWWKWSRARDIKRSCWPGAQKPKGNKQRMSLLYQSSRSTISEKRAEVWDQGDSEKEKRHPLSHAAAFACKASQITNQRKAIKACPESGGPVAMVQENGRHGTAQVKVAGAIQQSVQCRRIHQTWSLGQEPSREEGSAGKPPSRGTPGLGGTCL